ncbi:hypothetical protein [Yersinia ruckeri]|uniref:hypothetical protein n=1 Tax=Yersinia ruckeri TaxID=29486 RepID=UPI0022388432|nr:hypothetical protein [Yersinia ruckeri]MCW6598745.1 hypothetical protein [Yersinia ruckeri]
MLLSYELAKGQQVTNRIQEVQKVPTLMDYDMIAFSDDAAKLFIGLCEFELANRFPDAFKREVELFDLYKTSLRLATRLDLEVSFGTIAFLVMGGNCTDIRDLSLYFHAIKRYCRVKGSNVFGLEDFATAFKGGVPSPESLDKAWEGQQLPDGTNAVDHLVKYGA